ncbi:MAG: flagellar biosynthetic protein FliR [Pseudomonadota bacterium]
MIELSLPAIQQFLLVLVRTASFVTMFPVFGGAGVPVQIRAGLSFVLALVLYPVVRSTLPLGVLPTTVVGLAGVVIAEMIVGFILGLSVRMLLSAAELGGHMVGYQMGFGIMSIMDPQTQSETSLMAELAYLVALLVFLAAGGHHAYIRAMAASFNIVPLGGLVMKGAIYRLLMADCAHMFVLAVKMSAPTIAALLFTTLGFALLSRAVPQINIFVVGMPVSIAVGLIFFGLSLQLALPLMSRETGGMGTVLLRLLKAM